MAYLGPVPWRKPGNSHFHRVRSSSKDLGFELSPVLQLWGCPGLGGSGNMPDGGPLSSTLKKAAFVPFSLFEWVQTKFSSSARRHSSYAFPFLTPESVHKDTRSWLFRSGDSQITVWTLHSVGKVTTLPVCLYPPTGPLDLVFWVAMCSIAG